MSVQGRGRIRADTVLLIVISAAVSLAAFFYFFSRGQILLYGDAVAHINIARRVFDSLTPGWRQLGTVWLPLPHILMLPFVVSDGAWRTGVGGSIVSMIAFVFGSVGIAHLFWRGALRRSMRAAGWIASFFYLANPNLIYLQATAMTESLSLALYVWVIIFFVDFQRHREAALAGELLSWQRPLFFQQAGRSLQKCGIVLALGMLTRYDFWALTLMAITGSATLILRSRDRVQCASLLRRSFRRFFLLCALIPILWLAYNFAIYGHALEFATGPYSARAIAQRSQGSMATYPGERSAATAALYFFKSAELNLAAHGWIVPILLASAVGVVILFWWKRKLLLALVLLPIAFYGLSIAYGSVPIFLPAWWPFSYYNVRYGIELLPAFAIFIGVTFWLLQQPSRWRFPLSTILIVILAGAYASVWRQSPICLREARINSVTRIAFEKALTQELKKLPAGSSLLMFTGSHVGALEAANFHLARTINENNYRLWQAALLHPAHSSDYVLAIAGDPVSRAVQADSVGLTPIATIQTKGAPVATLYRSESSGKP